MSSPTDLSVAEARSIANRAARALSIVDTPGAIRHLEGIRTQAELLASRIERMSATAESAFHEANP